MKATVILADPEERHEVEIDGRDRRAFERAIPKLDLPVRAVKDVAGACPETYVAFLAWHALTRGGLDLTFPAFETRLVEVIGVSQDATEDPTMPAASAG